MLGPYQLYHVHHTYEYIQAKQVSTSSNWFQTCWTNLCLYSSNMLNRYSSNMLNTCWIHMFFAEKNTEFSKKNMETKHPWLFVWNPWPLQDSPPLKMICTSHPVFSPGCPQKTKINNGISIFDGVFEPTFPKSSWSLGCQRKKICL